MKKFITRSLIITIMAIIISPASVLAANHYILQGGTGNGTSWSSALNDLPEYLVRGDTYYIADGTYGAHMFNDAESGTTYITIKKATAIDHGTDTGWQTSYGDGQAVFKGLINFTKGYYIWDGITGTGSNYSAYGFKTVPLSCPSESQLLGIPGIGYSSYQVNNIRVSHTAMVQCGEGDGTNNQTGIYSLARDASYASSDITISNNYFSGSSSNMLLRQANRWIIENNYFAGNWSSASNHGQQISPGGCDDFVLRGNIFKDSTVFIIGAHAPINRRWQIYNNIVIGGTLSAGWSNAAASEKDNVVQWQIHNNTYFNVNFGGRGVVFPGLLTDIFASRSYAYNNLFYNCIHPRMDNPDATVGAIIHDNNAYLSCTGIYSSAAESAPLIGSADPFVDSAGGNYQLRTGSLPINKGKVLIAAYSKDYNGVTRPQGGAWDIGAYEYLTAQSTLFVTSVNGTVTSNPSGINCGATCYANFNAVEWVTLNAVPNNGYIFAGWSGGGCSGTGACKVYMASAQTVTANYAAVSTVPTIPTAKYYLAVNKTVNAGGTIISSDKTINCGSTCKSYYNSGKTVTLYLSTNSGYRFTRWTGACQGQGTTCNVKMDTSKNTKAYFEVLGGTLFYPEGAMK